MEKVPKPRLGNEQLFGQANYVVTFFTWTWKLAGTCSEPSEKLSWLAEANSLVKQQKDAQALPQSIS